jgi:hypothetical protein
MSVEAKDAFERMVGDWWGSAFKQSGQFEIDKAKILDALDRLDDTLKALALMKSGTDQTQQDLTTANAKVELLVAIFAGRVECPEGVQEQEPCPPDNGQQPGLDDCKGCWREWLTEQ